MLFEATKTNAKYEAGKTYHLDENNPLVKPYIETGVLVEAKKPAERKTKIVTKRETK